jgi:deoxyribodipyrimidine photo-lyase
MNVQALRSGGFAVPYRSMKTSLGDPFPPTRAAALERIAAIVPRQYAVSRNALDGAVTRLSPYLTHGIVSIHDVVAGVCARHALRLEDKLVFELAWREYFHHALKHRPGKPDASLTDPLRPAPWPGEYAATLPADLRSAQTGVPVIDASVRTLYNTGYLHNHARMWLASYAVHIRKVAWQAGAQWMVAHLLDGDLASNHLSWQWVAGTWTGKPYLFNAENVARYAPALASPGTVIDTDYATLDRIARSGDAPTAGQRAGAASARAPDAYEAASPNHGKQAGLFDASPPIESQAINEPSLFAAPPMGANVVFDATELPSPHSRDVTLVHPWMLHDRTADGRLRIGFLHPSFHAQYPWSEKRWRFVLARMREVCDCVYAGDPERLAQYLAHANSVNSQSTENAHYKGVFEQWIAHIPGSRACLSLRAAPQFFPSPPAFCPSFSSYWNKVTKQAKNLDALLGSRGALE